MSTVLINAPASPVLGGGHLGRCLRLAEAFSLRGHEVVFLLADLGGGFPDRVLEAGFSLETILAEHRQLLLDRLVPPDPRFTPGQ